MIVALFYLIIMAVLIASYWKIFTKAGRPGWESLIPIYNFYIQCQFTGVKNWWIIFIPFVNIYIAVVASIAMAKSFGKDVGFAIGLIFLGFVFYPILGFGNNTYIGPNGVRTDEGLLQHLKNDY